MAAVGHEHSGKGQENRDTLLGDVWGNAGPRVHLLIQKYDK